MKDFTFSSKFGLNVFFPTGAGKITGSSLSPISPWASVRINILYHLVILLSLYYATTISSFIHNCTWRKIVYVGEKLLSFPLLSGEAQDFVFKTQGPRFK